MATAFPLSERFTIDLTALLTPHDLTWSAPLPSDWREGAPLGNGDFGAVISGPPRDLAFTLGKSDVWDRRDDDRSYYPGRSFAEVRQAFLNGDRDAYDRILREMAADKPVDMPHLTTCGTLRLHLDEGLNPDGPAMRVRLQDGTAVLTYNDRRVEAFISPVAEVLVIMIDRGEGLVNPDPNVDCYDRRLPSAQLPWSFSRPVLDGNAPLEVMESGDLSFGVQRFAAGGGYVVGIGFSGFDGHVRASLPNRLCGCLEKPRTRRVQAFLAIVSFADAVDPVAVCRERLRQAMAAGEGTLALAHQRWWQDFWMQGLASVADAAVEKWYYRSLYLCGSMLRAGRQSPGLQGVWCGENYPVWYGDYHGNVNIQCLYWGLFAGNRLEWIEPFLRLYEGFAPHARDVARDYYGMRGLKFPHAGSIGGHELTAGAHSRLSTDPCETAWIAQLFWDYYRYSQDLEFLRTRAYPIIRDAALLLADYLVWDEQRGAFIMPPMLHFESFAGEESGWDVNTLYGQAFFRMGFRQAIAAAATLDCDPELRREWGEKMDRLAPPPMTGDGRWKAWENREDRIQGHSFLLPLVFPAGLVSAWHGPAEWRGQACRTWAHIRDNALQSLTGGAWCGGQGILEILRLGDMRSAFERARWKPGETAENGFILGAFNGNAFIQVDHGPGVCRVLGEMLVLETDGIIRLFAGIPADVPARFFRLRAPGGFILSAERRGGAVDYVLVRAVAPATLRLASPWGGAWCARWSSGAAETGRSEVIELRLVAEQDILLTPEGTDIQALAMEGFHAHAGPRSSMTRTVLDAQKE